MSLILAPFSVLDSSGATKTLSSYSDGTNNIPVHLIGDATTGLPLAVATGAKQDTGNTSLASILAQLSPVTTAMAMSSGAGAIPAGRYFYVNATTAGNITVTLSGGGTLILACAVGPNFFNMAVTTFTTNTATVANAANLS